MGVEVRGQGLEDGDELGELLCDDDGGDGLAFCFSEFLLFFCC